MADNSKISWTDTTWPVTRGCSRVSEGCRRCYAERMAHRLGQNPSLKGAYTGLTRMTSQGPVWTGEVRCVPEELAKPLSWKKPRRVFVSSMSDLFHPSVPEAFIQQVFAIMAATPSHTYQILTKRPERMADVLNHPHVCHFIACSYAGFLDVPDNEVRFSWPLPNVHLGTSIENQKTADERIPHLLRCPAAVRWISAEPLLGPVNLAPWISGSGRVYGRVSAWGDEIVTQHPRLDWVVCGGESGPRFRPMDMAWARSLRDQCVAAGVPLWFKQQSGYRSETNPWIEEEDGTRTPYRQTPGEVERE